MVNEQANNCELLTLLTLRPNASLVPNAQLQENLSGLFLPLSLTIRADRAALRNVEYAPMRTWYERRRPRPSACLAYQIFKHCPLAGSQGTRALRGSPHQACALLARCVAPPGFAKATDLSLIGWPHAVIATDASHSKTRHRPVRCQLAACSEIIGSKPLAIREFQRKKKPPMGEATGGNAEKPSVPEIRLRHWAKETGKPTLLSHQSTRSARSRILEQ